MASKINMQGPSDVEAPPYDDVGLRMEGREDRIFDVPGSLSLSARPGSILASVMVRNDDRNRGIVISKVGR